MKTNTFFFKTFVFGLLLMTIACKSGNSQTDAEFSKLIENFTKVKTKTEDLMYMLNELYKDDISQIKNEKLLYINVKASQNTIINKVIVDINNNSFVNSNYTLLFSELNSNLTNFVNSSMNKVSAKGAKFAWGPIIQIGVSVAIAIYDYVNELDKQKRQEMIRMLESVKIK